MGALQIIGGGAIVGGAAFADVKSLQRMRESDSDR